jgi:cysteinyl-tRNA synthetase
VLGGGSNLVLTGDVKPLVLKVEVMGRRVAAETAKAVIVEAGAGEGWHDLVAWTLQQGYAGLENMALIPGTVGASPVQNVGAYGVELQDRFESLDAIDLHTGGVDLLFPHHENEIAQSQCCNDTLFAHHWYHSEHLLVDGKKMSKSLGNLYTLDQLKEMGHSPMALRYALLAGHPRKQLNFTLEALPAAEKALAQLRAFRAALIPGGTADPFASALAALQDDLNTPQALGIVFTAIHAGPAGVALAAFDRLIFALGLDLTEPAKPAAATPPEVAALAEQRWAAKAAKNWAEADRLRGAIAVLGWSMLDRKDGYALEPAKK